MVACFLPPPFYSVSGLSSDGETLLSLSRHWISIPPSLVSTWNDSDANPCSWVGVLCDRNKLVISLDLSKSQISGELGPEISRLTQLKYLNLSFNHLSGQIPSSISNCSRLQQLDLSLNDLTGKIPDSFGNLRLKSLILSNNSLNGSIPESIFHISGLEVLLLSSNQLTGLIPSNLGNATMLNKLCLDDNHFTGSLPDSLNDLANLVYLDVHKAGVEGRIPLGSNGCKDLIYLDLSFNNFIRLPPELGNCSNLQQFAVVKCRLTGEIPSSFGQLTKLTLLYLSINELSGKIPTEIANCSSLSDLQLDQNQLEGGIPSELGILKLKSLFLFTNRLTGEVPMSIWKIETLEHLLIYENRLFGELPIEVAQMKQLKEFTLFTNHFSGVIPQSLGMNSDLVILDFLDNSFTGPIPPNLCFRKKLERLVLGFNNFEGGIPSNLGNCPNLLRLRLENSSLTGVLPEFVNNPTLDYMNFENNNFTGEIPASIGNLTNISQIILSMNRFSGVLPKELGNLVHLRALNLSHNAFEGPLPSQLTNCRKMLEFDASDNQFNGSIPYAFQSMSGLMRLYLSDNQFSGNIPDFISEFQALIDLQLDGNALNGTIPSSIVELKSLDTLNISRNHLTAELRVLTGLNISYNLFTGQIPSPLMKFLNSSFDSFLGNPDLCVDCGSNCDPFRNFKLCPGSSNKQKGLSKFHTAMVALATSACLFAVVIGVGFMLQCRQREKHDIEEVYPDKEDDDVLFQRVMQATEDLNDRYIIGRGAHGTVYKASLGQNGVFAVKKLMFGASKEGSTSMVREIETVGKVRHRNLVRLEDFWMRKNYGLILYRYMHNGSLHDILHEMHPPPLLDWSIRCNIALGTAHGLAYLHFDCDPAIVHRDIKPMNILLDDELEPHISDFGIAKLLDQSSPALMSGILRGTIGYIAPENAFTNTKSMESDVYSYGVVLLELITRKKAVDDSFADGLDIVRWVKSVWSEKVELEVVVDSGLYDDLYDSFVREQVTEVLQLALRCTETEPNRRPSMREVVKELEDVYGSLRSKLK
ncbi:unnamed protein product [Lactuca virosa]|uniref:non-specific serine/threonine protein kinase n=1 Tax=Lactuca virosa TaxID=75947 RepID=A0AAU9MFP9_9ASTR|nr:unnamed protein product [Lactuca virosa]